MVVQAGLRSRLGQLFSNRGGVRSGALVLAFAVLLYVLKYAFGACIFAVPFLRIPFQAIASGSITPGGIFALELRNLSAAAASALIMMRLEARPLESCGFPLGSAFTTLSWKGFAVGLGSAFLLFGVLRTEGAFSFGHLVLDGPRTVLYSLWWIGACVLIGLYEEFVFRGYVLHTLWRGMGFWPAAALSSVLFGLVHIGNGDDPWYISLSAAAFGLLYSFSVLQSGSAWFALGLHAAFDYAETFLFSPIGGLRVGTHLFDCRLHGPAWLNGGVAGPEASINGVWLFLLLFLIVKRLGTARNTSETRGLQMP